MYIPSSTYRIQFNKDFTFKDLEPLVDYLADLGIGAVYASPICQAIPGSNHGYDVTDPHIINPEIGTEAGFEQLVRKLNAKGIRWIQDIVPNHMAFSTFNTRIYDVMERKTHSPYFHYFDINWNAADETFRGRLMTPLLGDDPDTCAENGQLRLVITENGICFQYYDYCFPLCSDQYRTLLAPRTTNQALVEKLNSFADAALTIQDLGKWGIYKKEWSVEIFSLFHRELTEIIDTINADSHSLNDLLHQQHYRLCKFDVTDKQITYRRFFTVNTLICLNIQDKAVFDDYHAYYKKLYDKKLIQGFRIDHIDGLNDPAQYIDDLRAFFGKECYIIAEKILENAEVLPRDWHLQGTSGYEFLSFTSQLLTDRAGADKIRQYYDQLVQHPPYQELVRNKKSLILYNYMNGELDNLLALLEEQQLVPDGMHRHDLREAIANLMIAFPVYRIYPGRYPLEEADARYVQQAVAIARRMNDRLGKEIEYLQSLFFDNPGAAASLKFIKRFSQFTGPLTAKGVEDTTFYVYNALIAHNEVGDSPEELGCTTDFFHLKMEERMGHIPHSLNTLSTHDTKRGEDARIRINTLAELQAEWRICVDQWREMNRSYLSDVNGRKAPTTNDEYFIYQTIIGGYPASLNIDDACCNRMEEYMVKVMREAKENSSWVQPDDAYEKACTGFMKQILQKDSAFTRSLLPLLEKIQHYALIYMLGQTVLKINAPGIPDTYQGCELWDLSFVDPDNRRPVNYGLRRQLMEELKAREEKPFEETLTLLREKHVQGIQKMFISRTLLHYRRQQPELFSEGSYIPVKITGAQEGIAFLRQHNNQYLLTAVPLKLSGGYTDEETFVELPAPAGQLQWTNLFTKETIEAKGSRISFAQLFGQFPVAALSAGSSSN
jgi:(1->4)-alpha-D-glucan 1-alpha-D-glucosylmutase